MILFHDIIHVFYLPDDDGRAMLCVVALHGGFIRLTAVNGDRLEEPVTADRFLEQPEGRLCVSMLRQQKVNGLAVLVHGAIEIAPLAFDFDGRLVHAPADPRRALAAVQGFFQERVVFDHPPVDGGVIHVDPTFQHEFFDVARAQGVGDLPADTQQNNVWREMSPFEADRHRLAPPWQHGLEGETIPQIASNENLRQNHDDRVR